MNRYFLAGIFILSLCSCTNDREPQKDKATKEVKAVKKESASKKSKSFSGRSFELPKLSSENCVELLTEYGEKNRETKVWMSTPLGEVLIRLYENTPVHRANFIYMTKQKFFDETVFYRVMDTFMIQGGNSDQWETQRIKADIGKYTLPSEMKEGNFHKRGALAAARSYTNNPNKKSSPFVFFIVQRGPIAESGMKYMEIEEGNTYTPEIRQHYLDYGGTPGLDGEHTVFGEVISGIEVVDAIAKVETDGKNWPKESIWIKMEVLD